MLLPLFNKLLISAFKKLYVTFSWNHWRAAALTSKLLYPTSNCAYINTFIPIHCVHAVIKVDHRRIFHGQKLYHGTVNCMSSQPSNFHWRWTRVMDSCGFKDTYIGGEILRDWVKLVLSIFHYYNVAEGAKLLSPLSYDDPACTILSFQETMCMEHVYLCVWL